MVRFDCSITFERLKIIQAALIPVVQNVGLTACCGYMFYVTIMLDKRIIRSLRMQLSSHQWTCEHWNINYHNRSLKSG